MYWATFITWQQELTGGESKLGVACKYTLLSYLNGYKYVGKVPFMVLLEAVCELFAQESYVTQSDKLS